MKLRTLFSLSAILILADRGAHAGEMTVDSHESQIRVAVTATIDSFVGHLDKYQTQIDFAPNSPLPDKARVSFDFKDLETGNSNRDQAMLDWLDYTKDPTCQFTLKDWKTSDTTNLAEGTISIHGIKELIKMPVAVKHNGTHCEIKGTAKLDYHNFGLPTICKMLFLKVNPHLVVSFDLKGTLPNQ